MNEKATQYKRIAMSPVVQSAATFITVGGIDMLAHLGPTGIVVGAIGAFVAYRHGNDIVSYVRSSALLSPGSTAQDAMEADEAPEEEETYYAGKRSIGDRLMGRYPQTSIRRSSGVEDNHGTDDNEERDPFIDDEADDELFAPPVVRSQKFSDVLQHFTPTLSRIYLATLPDGTPLYCAAKDLCHVAIAGSTGNGKSSITRLLMSQLCKAGASVLLLDPHYTPYDLESGEDWTPFTPYLVYDPMETCKYEVIEHYLRQIATAMIPKRLERRRQGKQLGKPYFLVLDELPDIMAEVKGAAGYLKKILREGRKVGVFVVASSQDFLVKTIFPEGEGAVRSCYQTAYDVGGDATTSRVLLGIPSSAMPTTRLGKGPVMIRCNAQEAMLARVPYTDNDTLYTLLGPSTYKPSKRSVILDDDIDLDLDFAHPHQSMPAMPRYTSGAPILHEVDAQPERVVPTTARAYGYGYGYNGYNHAPATRRAAAMEEMEALPMRQQATVKPLTELERAVEAYRAGNTSVEKLQRALDITHHRAYQLYRLMREGRLI